MRQSIIAAALAIGMGLTGLSLGAAAQQLPQTYAPVAGIDPLPKAASPSGAVYIPGVGFRYLAAGSPRVYGWTSGRVYGYRARTKPRACRDRDWWGWDRCWR